LITTGVIFHVVIHVGKISQSGKISDLDCDMACCVSAHSGWLDQPVATTMS